MGDVRPLIGVNLLYARPGYHGGTVRYAQELLKHLVQLDRYRWMLYLQRNAFPITEAPWLDLPRREIKVIGGLLGRVAIEHAGLPWVAQRDGVDLMFSPGFVSPLWGEFRKVVTIHDLYYRRFPSFVRPWQRRYWRLFMPASLRMADAAIAISDSTLIDVCDAFPWARHKVRRVYLGADTLGSADNEDQRGPPFCLMVGNLTPNKNLETVVAAFAELKARGLNYRLIIAGSDLFGRLAAMLREMRIPPNIELMQHVDDITLATLYSSALCLIQASHYEGFGLPIVEAMHQGCPVIASDISVLREIAGNAALFFSPSSSTALAEAVEKLTYDKALRLHLAKAGAMHASRFHWDDTARETAELFDAVLGL